MKFWKRLIPLGKATGPDGYGVEFYKANASVLAPLLICMLNHSIELEKFPDSLYEAYVCLLRKKDRDDTVPANYRPISLLNCDQKVIAKILTIWQTKSFQCAGVLVHVNRLNKHIDSLIHSEQTGFIPGRFSFCNSRRLLNILYNNQSTKSKAAILSLCGESLWPNWMELYVLGVRMIRLWRKCYAVK